MRRVVPIIAACSLFAFPAAAQAGKSQLRVFQDDRLLLYSGPLVRAAILDQARDLGVDVIRTQFVWRNIATGDKPKNAADPNSYGANWSNWDSLVIEARKRGMDILATVTGPAPGWAAGKTGKFFNGSRYPDAKAYGDFMKAVGRRYDGKSKTAVASRAAGLFLLDPPPEPAPCIPLPPLITCPEPPPPSGGGGGGGSAPPPGGEQSPPPDPGSGQPTPPQPANTPLPKIRMWSVYNEPNHPLFLSPQRRKGVLVAPSLYRALYRAGWNALAKTGHRRDTILIGETLPIGSNANRETSTTSPLTFARELFCLNGGGRRHPGCGRGYRKLQAGGWAVHPYYRKTGPFSRPPGPDDITPVTLGKLKRLLDKAGSRGKVSRGLHIWDTENGAQTHPDPKGAPAAKQARYINEAEYLAWRTPYLRTYSQYLMVDEDAVWAFQSGLRYKNGDPKPALQAYQLPLYVKRAGRAAVVWGRIPHGGDRKVTIQPRGGRAVTISVRGRGYFTHRFAKRARSYTLRYGAVTSRAASAR